MSDAAADRGGVTPHLDGLGVGDERTSRDPVAVVCDSALRMAAASGGLTRLSVRHGDVSVELEWPAPTPVPNPAQAASAGPTRSSPPTVPVAEAAPQVAGTRAVVSPMVGTFYRAPEPGAAPFVVEGDQVHMGQQIGIIEAMKLMNPVEADHDGRVVAIEVSDGAAVEYDQPLIVLAFDTAEDE